MTTSERRPSSPDGRAPPRAGLRAVSGPNSNEGLRWLLVLVLVNGLAPGIAEAAEVAVHFVETGHVAHTLPGEDDLGHQGPEHSCGVVFHQCGCCAGMTLLPHEVAEAGRPAPSTKDCAPVAVMRGASRSLEPPFRPPIR